MAVDIGSWDAARMLLQIEAEAAYLEARRYAAAGFEGHAIKAQQKADRLAWAERSDRFDAIDTRHKFEQMARAARTQENSAEENR